MAVAGLTTFGQTSTAIASYYGGEAGLRTAFGLACENSNLYVKKMFQFPGSGIRVYGGPGWEGPGKGIAKSDFLMQVLAQDDVRRQGKLTSYSMGCYRAAENMKNIAWDYE